MGFRSPDDPPSPLGWARLLERASATANPPDEWIEDHGWALRFSELGFNRLSSAWPRADRGALSIHEHLDGAVAFYRERGQAPRIVTSPASLPTGLDPVLAGAGWEISARVEVQVRRLPRLQIPGLGPPDTAEAGRYPGQPEDRGEPVASGLRVCCDVDADDEWLAAWATADPRVAAHPEAAARMAMPERDATRAHAGAPAQLQHARCFVSVRDGHRVVAIGRGVLDPGGAGAGLFGVATAVPYRRRGLALSVTERFHRWAEESRSPRRPTPRTWLQVESDNEGAVRLYRSLGYTTVYRSTCWWLPAGGPDGSRPPQKP